MATAPSIPGDGGVDFGGPGVDAAAQGLGVFEALVAEPDGDVHGADSLVAKGDEVGFRVQLPEGAARDVAHRNVRAAFDVRSFVLPGLAYVEENVTFGTIGSKQLLQFLRGYLIIHHRDENTGPALLLKSRFSGA